MLLLDWEPECTLYIEKYKVFGRKHALFAVNIKKQVLPVSLSMFIKRGQDEVTTILAT